MQAKELIEHTMFENLPLDRIASEVGLSSYSLIRAFHKTFGTSPHAWRMKARVRAAASELQLRRMPLAQIAVSCGFSDQSHLSRTFKRIYGITPGRYRLMHKV